MKTHGARIVLAAIASLAALEAHAYDRASIENRTVYPVTITVRYAACRSDTFDVAGGTLVRGQFEPGRATSPVQRGGCLITGVNATLKGTNTAVTPYTNQGTSYSRFAVDQADGKFSVKCLQP